MDKKPKNPTAFPAGGWWSAFDEGMSLRDYFAAKAMQAITAGPMSSIEYLAKQWPGKTVGEALANQSYAIADSMLKAREQM